MMYVLNNRYLYGKRTLHVVGIAFHCLQMTIDKCRLIESFKFPLFIVYLCFPLHVLWTKRLFLSHR